MIGLDYTGLILKGIEDFPNAILNLTVVWNQVQNNPIQSSQSFSNPNKILIPKKPKIRVKTTLAIIRMVISYQSVTLHFSLKKGQAKQSIMRTRLYLLFILIASYFSAFGQTFFPVGGPLHTQEVALEQANEAYIHFDNPSGDTLKLRWRRLEVNKPDDWDIDLCDYGLCYIGIPSNGTMSHVFDTIQPYLKLIVQPGQTPGAAWIWFRVYELGNEANFQDVYFSLNTPGVTASNEPVPSFSVSIFPNPATDIVNITSENSEPVVCRVFDAYGRLMFENKHLLETTIPTAIWPSGSYWINLGGVGRQLMVSH